MITASVSGDGSIYLKRLIGLGVGDLFILPWFQLSSLIIDVEQEMTHSLENFELIKLNILQSGLLEIVLH